MLMDKDEITIPSHSCAPDDILEFIKGNNLPTLLNSNSNQTTEETETEEIQMKGNIANATLNDPCDNENEAKENIAKTQWALASAAMEQKKVTAVPERKNFVVEGSRGDSYSVKLFPYEKCQCPSTNTCYHIIAAKMSIGMDTKDVKGKVNLTQLRKNSRKRVDKKSGRKKASSQLLRYNPGS